MRPTKFFDGIVHRRCRLRTVAARRGHERLVSGKRLAGDVATNLRRAGSKHFVEQLSPFAAILVGADPERPQPIVAARNAADKRS